MDVDTATGNATVMDPSGVPLLVEAGRKLVEVVDKPTTDMTYEITQTWESPANEAVYGGGQYQNGMGNV